MILLEKKVCIKKNLPFKQSFTFLEFINTSLLSRGNDVMMLSVASSWELLSTPPSALPPCPVLPHTLTKKAS